MFERFTERARQVVVLAQEEARALGHDYIGTEHVLLGLLREEEGLAARVLESLDIGLEDVRERLLLIVGPGEGVPRGQIPFTPPAKKVLELALREALSLKHNYIGTEHILLGLIREREGVAARILLDLDADGDKIRGEVMRMVSGPSLRRVETQFGSASAGPPTDDPGEMLARIERHIRGLLHREPDNGDLLVILATLPEGIVGRVFRELGVDDEALDAALERARAAGPDEIDEQIELVRRRKDDAIDGGDLDAAARHRAEERRLTGERDADLITRVRERLGLAVGEARAEPESRAGGE